MFDFTIFLVCLGALLIVGVVLILRSKFPGIGEFLINLFREKKK